MKVFGLNVKIVPDTQDTDCSDCALTQFCYPRMKVDEYNIPTICDDDNYHYELED